MKNPVRHRRSRIALLAILCLLCQQLAMAAACAMPLLPAPAMSEHCAEAGIAMHRDADPQAPCQTHDAAGQAVLGDHAPPAVPMQALPPPLFPLALQAAAPAASPLAAAMPLHSDPPPRLRYCTLLI